MTRVEFETYGCAANQADTEYMAGLLEKAGFDTGPEGDIIVLNTCTVKTPTERKIIKRIRELLESGRQVIVTGCLPAATPEVAKRFPEASFIGVNVSDILDTVEAVRQGRRIVRITDRAEDSDVYSKVRQNPFVEIIPISRGCLGNCSYCLVRSARGRLRSTAPETLLSIAKRSIEDGIKEIWLTSQDTGAYGRDIGSSLPELLKSVCSPEGNHMIRVGMMNPNHVRDCLDDLIPCFLHERVYKFIHIPVQSGDDTVLRDMNRRYTVAEFEEIVGRIREAIPGITISTDLIAGYPTEDDCAFENTLKLLDRIKPEVLNISRYWKRPKTPAGELKQLPGRVTKDRSRKLVKRFRSYAKEENDRWIGWEGRALVSGEGKEGSYCARNLAYKPIVIESGENLLGRWVNVRITDATYYDFRGEITCLGS